MKTQTHLSVDRIKKVLSNPNTLTLFRIVATPAIVLLLLYPNRFCSFMAALLFSAASITDYLDGYFARQHGLVSTFGKIMDPVADKFLVSCSLIMLAAIQWIPGWVVCIIIGRELAISGLRNVAVEKGEDVSASMLGKYKTGFQIAAIIPLLIHFPYFHINFHAIGMFFLWGAVIFTVWSGVDYFMKYKKYLEA